MTGLGQAGHLVRRLVGSLDPNGPPGTDEDWVAGVLSPAEAALWRRMSGPDRRHAVGVARKVDRRLGPEVGRPALAAALLHDVGKTEAGLGTAGRVVATVVGLAAGRTRAASWSDRTGPVGRVGLYLRHGELGARLLSGAGSDALTVAWARCHHLPSRSWDPAIPPAVGQVLKASDDD